MTRQDLNSAIALLRDELTVSDWTGVYAYDPANEKVAAFHADKSKVRCLFGGNRSGKSEAGGKEIVDYAETHHHAVVWACGVSYDALGEYVYPKIEKYLTMSHDVAWANRIKKIPALIRLENGAVIYFKSYEQGREKFQGAAVDLIWLDEESPEDIFDECIARTVDRGGRIILTMTPLKGLTWVYDRLYQPKMIGVKHWTMSMLENKHIPEDHKQAALAMMSEEERRKRVEGKFVRMEGAVWKEFDNDRNLVKRFPIPTHWRRIRAVDFGYTNPFVCLWIALSPEGEAYVYNEWYKSQTLIEEHAKAIVRLDGQGLAEGAILRQIDATIADHDAQGRAELETAIYRIYREKHIDAIVIETLWQYLGSHFALDKLLTMPYTRQDLRECANYAGCPSDIFEQRLKEAERQATQRIDTQGVTITTRITPAKKDIEEGVSLVNRAFMKRPNGRASLYIFDDLPCVVKETRNYCYAMRKRNRNEPETPNPVDDHTQDAMRYGIMHLAPSMGLSLNSILTGVSGIKTTGHRSAIQATSLRSLKKGGF